jgi:hypothetical protein
MDRCLWCDVGAAGATVTAQCVPWLCVSLEHLVSSLHIRCGAQQLQCVEGAVAEIGVRGADGCAHHVDVHSTASSRSSGSTCAVGAPRGGGLCAEHACLGRRLVDGVCGPGAPRTRPGRAGSSRTAERVLRAFEGQACRALVVLVEVGVRPLLARSVYLRACDAPVQEDEQVLAARHVVSIAWCFAAWSCSTTGRGCGLAVGVARAHVDVGAADGPGRMEEGHGDGTRQVRDAAGEDEAICVKM